MAKTNEQLLRDALEKTTGLITSILAFKDSGGIDLDQPIMENTKALALEALERTTLDASVMTKDQAIAILEAERVL